MRFRLKLLISIVVAVFGLIPSAQAQKSTEAFIPIGKSPGISGVTTYLGVIDSVDLSARTVTIRGDGSSRSVEITENTKIWLDQSGYKAKNRSATIEDLKIGRRIEAKPELDVPDQAEWIKIDPGNGG